MRLKILAITAFLVIILAGCQENERKKTIERQALEIRFQQAYGQNWQQKLLEYDIQQEREQYQQKMELKKAYLQGSQPVRVKIE